MPTIHHLVGARVRELRKAKGWSLEALAERADKHYTYISGLKRKTEVWIADDPDHVVHFNGERFLGPYPDTMC